MAQLAGANILSAPEVVYIASDRGIAARYWEGDIAEVLLYDDALSTADALVVERYLGTKWGITVA